MGTPHKGSWMAGLGQSAAVAIGLVKSTSTKLLEVLKKDNEHLKASQYEFWSMMRKEREGGRRLEATCFYEELPLLAWGVVVPQDSATVDGYNKIGIHDNHCDMVRFGSEEDSGYKRVLGELFRWENEVRSPSGQIDGFHRGKFPAPGFVS